MYRFLEGGFIFQKEIDIKPKQAENRVNRSACCNGGSETVCVCPPTIVQALKILVMKLFLPS